MSTPPWMDWAQRLQAVAQNGLAFSKNEFDRLRYQDIQTIATEMLADHTGEPAASFQAVFDSERGYATPKVDVRGAVFDGERILLVRERSDGRWTLPGGWADVGLSVAENVVKEIHEESGYEAAARRVLAVYDMQKHEHPPFLYHVYKIFVECELTGGAAAHSVETEGAEFFALDALPELSLQRVTLRQIARLFELHADPGASTDFD